MLPIIGLFSAFVFVVFLLYKKVHLAPSFFLGALMVGMTKGPDPLENIFTIFPTLVKALLDPLTLELLLLVAFVTILAHLLEQLGFLRKMITSLENLLHNLSLTIVFIPSLIGSLILPGGAILSAPIIKPIGEQLQLNREKIAAINIFYRHLWYFAFPYTQSLLVASSLSGLEVKKIVLMHLPIVFIMLVGGYLFLLPKGRKGVVKGEKGGVKEVITSILPLLVVILLPFISPVPFLGSLFFGILLAISMNLKDFHLLMLWNGLNFSLFFGVISIMVFKAFMQETQGVDTLIHFTMESGIPPLFLAAFFPFLIGILTGNHMGTITITYPILLSFFMGTKSYPVWMMILFASGFFGYIISPFHLCFAMTASFFQTTMTQIYRSIYPAVLFSLLGFILLTIIYFRWSSWLGFF